MSEMKTSIKAKDGKIAVLQTQQVEAIIALNQRAFNDVPTWRPYSRGRREVARRYVAEIPEIVIERWFKEGINFYSADPDMQRKVAQKLNDPEYRYLRTSPGRIRLGRARTNYAPPNLLKLKAR